MFKFTIGSDVFNSLLKRLAVLSGGDKEAVITFCLGNGTLDLYYSSKVDQTDTSSFFHEKLPVYDASSDGNASIFLSSLFAIKVPEFISLDRFPYCKEIVFSFAQSMLSINFKIKWNEFSKENATKLNFALKEQLEDLAVYHKLFDKDIFANSFEIDAQSLHDALLFCNFIKSDATSKTGNGCLIKVEDSTLIFTNTDSNMAVKYETPLLSSDLKKEFKAVISSSVLNAVKSFLPEEGVVKVSNIRNSLYISVADRIMLAPIIGTEYIIDDPREFFNLPTEHIATIELKPASLVSSSIINKSTDFNKKTILEFVDGIFNLKTDVDKTEELPGVIHKNSNISINGSYFLVVLQKLMGLSLSGDIYYEEASSKIVFVTPNKKLCFIVQGM
jgi:hypothetical protein